MNIRELIKEAKKGSTASQKCLFMELAPKMLITCKRYVKSAEDAEEIMLDGFCRMFESLGNFVYRSDQEMIAWIKKIMINECLMFLRKKNLFLVSTDQHHEELALEEEALNKLSADEIFQLIVQLPAGYRTVFNLHAVEGMTHKEIASQLGITEGTSKSQLSKAKGLLQKMLLQNQMHDENRKSR